MIPQPDKIRNSFSRELLNHHLAFSLLCRSFSVTMVSELEGVGGQDLLPLCDPSTQGLVLSKLCQPCNDLQRRTVSPLIRRPSL